MKRTHLTDLIPMGERTNVCFESQGTAHEWPTWRRRFREFAPRLFR